MRRWRWRWRWRWRRGIKNIEEGGNNKVVEEGIKKLRREIKVKRERGK